MLLSLVYVSSAIRLLDDQELHNLLEECRERNARLGITGMLLYKDGNFMQVLEGEDQTVRDLAHDIERDRRHKNFTVLVEEPIDHREFSNWTMAFNNLDHPGEMDIPGYSRFLNERLEPQVIGEGSMGLLLTFREHN